MSKAKPQPKKKTTSGKKKKLTAEDLAKVSGGAKIKTDIKATATRVAKE
jgi:bacteriocin-like protein